MKVIRQLKTPTSGLAEYLEIVGDKANWDEFRSHNSGASYRELSEALTQSQHGICAYCEIAISDRHRQVEHVIPQSEEYGGKQKATDVANMVACCMGGIGQIDEEERYTRHSRRNISCGQAKGSVNEEHFVDPRKLPALPSLLRVVDDGQIEADDTSCKRAGFPSERIARTIEILNLNAERLRLRREKRWNGLEEESGHIDDPEMMNTWIRTVLTPDEKGRLDPFFTTNRSYFGPLGNAILSEEPQKWI